MWILFAEGLRAIAMMHVEINDGNPRQAVHMACLGRRDSRIVEQAKAHRLIGFGVMSRRSNGTKCITRATSHHIVDRFARRPGRIQGSVHASGRNDGIRVQIGDALFRCASADMFDMRGGVNAQKLFLRRLVCLGTDQVGEFFMIQDRTDGPQAQRMFGMLITGVVRKTGGRLIQDGRHGSCILVRDGRRTFHTTPTPQHFQADTHITAMRSAHCCNAAHPLYNLLVLI